MQAYVEKFLKLWKTKNQKIKNPSNSKPYMSNKSY